MKKLISFVLTATMLMGVVGCGNTTATNTDTQEPTTENVTAADVNTEDDNALVVGLDDEFPPMGFRDENNNIVGFDIDLAKAAAEKMGVEVKFQPIDWDTKEVELETGKIDLIWNGFSITDERLEAMEFTNPYVKNKQIIIVKNDSDIQSKADLVGRNIGLQDGSSALDAVNADEMSSSLGDIATYATNILAFTDLDLGRIEAVVADEIVARYYLANNENDFRVIENGDFGDEVYGIAAKKGNTELITSLQEALDELSSDGTATEISNKWFGEDIYEHPVN